MSKFVLICIFPTLAYVLFYLHLLSSAITYPTPNASTIDAKKMTNSFEDIQDRLPNLPILGWQIMKNLTSDEKQGCSQYPDILDIEYRNKYWQIFKTYYSSNIREATYHLYGAYLGNSQTKIATSYDYNPPQKSGPKGQRHKAGGFSLRGV